MAKLKYYKVSDLYNKRDKMGFLDIKKWVIMVDYSCGLLVAFITNFHEFNHYLCRLLHIEILDYSDIFDFLNFGFFLACKKERKHIIRRTFLGLRLLFRRPSIIGFDEHNIQYEMYKEGDTWFMQKDNEYQDLFVWESEDKMWVLI